MNQWTQNYNPISVVWLSTAVAAIPVVVLFYLLAVKKTLAYRAAFYGFLASVLIAGFIFGMPWGMVTGAAAGGLVFGFIRIGWRRHVPDGPDLRAYSGPECHGCPLEIGITCYSCRLAAFSPILVKQPSPKRFGR